MNVLSSLRHQDLVTPRSGESYLKLYSQLKSTVDDLDNGPHDVLTRGGEVSVTEQLAGESFNLSYQRPDVIAKESLTLYRQSAPEESYRSETLELGRRGEWLQVTHRQDSTRDVFGDEKKTVLYVDPTTGEIG